MNLAGVPMDMDSLLAMLTGAIDPQSLPSLGRPAANLPGGNPTDVLNGLLASTPGTGNDLGSMGGLDASANGSGGGAGKAP